MGKPPIDAVAVFVRGESGYFCIKIPYLFYTHSGVLLALAEARGLNGSSCNDFTGTDLVFKRSYDLGNTWSDLKVLVSSNSTEEHTVVVGNAAPVQDLHSKRLFIPFVKNNEDAYMMYSDDNGASFSAPISMPHLTLDSWKWVGLGPPGGIQVGIMTF